MNKKFLVYEFEFVQEGDAWIAYPFDEKAMNPTHGYTQEEAFYMAADLMNCAAWGYRDAGEEMPAPTFNNKPRYGGYVAAVVAPVEYFEDECMTMAEAAEYLGVSSARIGQLVRNKRLEIQKSESHPLIVKASLDDYKASPRKAGRPRKSQD